MIDVIIGIGVMVIGDSRHLQHDNALARKQILADQARIVLRAPFTAPSSITDIPFTDSPRL